MGRSFFGHLVGICCVMLSIKDPYDKHTQPSLERVTTDDNGRPVLHILADNYRDAERFSQGTTYPGDVTRTLVHLGGRNWNDRIIDWNTTIETESKEYKDFIKGMTRKEYQEYIDKQRGCA